MALTGAKYEEATLGQYGSSYLSGDGDILDLSAKTATRYICAITFLTETQFQRLENLCGEVGSFSSVTAENAHNDATNGVGAAAASTDLTVGGSGQEFPTGVTVTGRWDYAELHVGACICYFAPR